jgi:hypothetical protein
MHLRPDFPFTQIQTRLKNTKLNKKQAHLLDRPKHHNMPTKTLHNLVHHPSTTLPTTMPPLIGSTEASPAAGRQEETLGMVSHNEEKGNNHNDCCSTETRTERTAMSLSEQASAADAASDNAANETATAISTRPTGPTNTWDRLVEQKFQLQACIDENSPSPSKLIYGTLPTLLQQVSLFESVESKQLQIIVQALMRQGILLPYASLLELINQQDDDPASTSSTTDTAQKLRTLQVQALVRLQLWSSFGEAFAELYVSQVEVKAKGTKQRLKKKKQNKKLKVLPENLLLQHTMQILSLTAFRLAPNRSFALFLQECLPKSLMPSSSASKLPLGTLERIFDNFEVPNPYLAPQDDDAPAVTTALNFVPSPRRVAIVKKQKAAAKEALQAKKDLEMKEAEEKAAERAKAKAKADSDKAHAKATAAAKEFIPGFSSSMALTQPVVASRTKNSLLMGRDGNSARSRFVGSHFNTNLTNASTLFRQVQVSDRRQQQQRQSGVPANKINSNNNKSESLSRKRPAPSKSTSLSSSASTVSSSSGSNSSRSSHSNQKQKSNENAMLPPPPISRRVVHETPNKSKPTSMAHRNNIVLETPRQPARRNNSRIFATNKNDKNESIGRTGESNADLVAQAFRAVQQRKR